MRKLTKAAIVGGGVLFAGWVGWGLYVRQTAKRVPYEQRRTVNGVEFREYPQLVLVETTAPDRRTAFRRLFGYISGANDGDESIPMTAPVETQDGESVPMTAPVRTQDGESVSMTAPVRSADEQEDEGVRMAFYLPPEYDPETAPEPTDQSVSLVTEPPKTVAADRFSWYAPEWRVERRTQKLLSTLERETVEPRGEPYLLQYDDPRTPPFMRRNEVAVAVAEEF